MTKRYLPLILIILTVAFFYFQKKESPVSEVKDISKKTLPTPSHPEKVVTKSEKKVEEASDVEEGKVSKKASPQWKKKLISSLKEQGGSTVKDISIEPIKSFKWKYQGIDLNVESVIVTLKNTQNESSSFKALIDSETGKILESWDRPVIDPVNPKEKFGLVLDSRYFKD